MSESVLGAASNTTSAESLLGNLDALSASTTTTTDAANAAHTTLTSAQEQNGKISSRSFVPPQQVPSSFPYWFSSKNYQHISVAVQLRHMGLGTALDLSGLHKKFGTSKAIYAKAYALLESVGLVKREGNFMRSVPLNANEVFPLQEQINFYELHCHDEPIALPYFGTALESRALNNKQALLLGTLQHLTCMPVKDITAYVKVTPKDIDYVCNILQQLEMAQLLNINGEPWIFYRTSVPAPLGGGDIWPQIYVNPVSGSKAPLASTPSGKEGDLFAGMAETQGALWFSSSSSSSSSDTSSVEAKNQWASSVEAKSKASSTSASSSSSKVKATGKETQTAVMAADKPSTGKAAHQEASSSLDAKSVSTKEVVASFTASRQQKAAASRRAVNAKTQAKGKAKAAKAPAAKTAAQSTKHSESLAKPVQSSLRKVVVAPPTVEEVLSYFNSSSCDSLRTLRQQGLLGPAAKIFWEHYNEQQWQNSTGEPIANWHRLLGTAFTPNGCLRLFAQEVQQGSYKPQATSNNTPESVAETKAEAVTAKVAADTTASVGSAVKASEADNCSDAAEVSSTEEDDEVENQPLPADYYSESEVAVAAESDANTIPAESIAESKSETVVAAGATSDTTHGESGGAGAVTVIKRVADTASESAAAVVASPEAVNSALKAPEADNSSDAAEVSSTEEDDEVENQPLPADYYSESEVAVAAESDANTIPAESIAESKSETVVAAGATSDTTHGESGGAGAVTVIKRVADTASESAAAVVASPEAVNSALKAPDAEISSSDTEVSSTEEEDEVEKQSLPADQHSESEVAVAAASDTTAVTADSVAESKSAAVDAADTAHGESVGTGAVRHSLLSLDLVVQRLQQHFAGNRPADANDTDAE